MSVDNLLTEKIFVGSDAPHRDNHIFNSFKG